MTLYGLIVKNRIPYDISNNIDAFTDWIKRKFPGIDEVKWEYLDTDLELKHKDFGVNLFDKTKSAWGLDGVKEQLRSLGKIYRYKYHVIAFHYELDPNWDFEKRPIGAWAYPNDLNGATFFESPSRQDWNQLMNTYRLDTHELLHCFHRLCWWKGISTNDTMDRYDEEFDIESSTGNRARNIAVLYPQLPKFLTAPAWIILEEIKQKAIEILKKIQKNPMSKLEEWAGANKVHEGWYVSSRSFRNNNPGNIKFGQLARDLGAYAADKDGFSIFRTYEDGWVALVEFLKLAATRQLKPYHKFNPTIKYHQKLLPNGTAGEELPDLTIIDFYNIYDEDLMTTTINEPLSYALFVSGRLKVDPQTLIKDLI